MAEMDQVPTSSESTSGEQDLSPPDSEKQTSQTSQPDGAVSVEDLEVTAAPGATDFTHPLLAGKSPEEIERVVRAMEASTKEQNVDLNRLQAQVNAQPAAPTPTEEGEEAEPYGDDFIGTRFKTFEGRMTKKLEETVAPLMASATKTDSESTREKLTKKFKHFASLEPHIDKLLRDQNIDPNTATQGHLEMLYHTAVGYAQESGIDLGGTEAPPPNTPAPTGEEASIVNIPQHRPSGTPLPDAPQTKVRKLTEQERIIAHAQFRNSKDPEAEYRALQDAEVDDIVEPGYSKAGWGGNQG